MKPSVIPQVSPVADWSQLHHGTLSDFIRARQHGFYNDEQLSAFAVEYAGMVQQIVHDTESGFCLDSRWALPVLKKLTRRGIEKYARSMQIWQTEILTWPEREAFVSAVVVWK